jgi:hypothetical protein
MDIPCTNCRMGRRRWTLLAVLLLVVPLIEGSLSSSWKPAVPLGQVDHDLSGWFIDTYDLKSERAADGRGQASHNRNKGLEVLSWEPRIFVFRGFLSDEECEEIKRLAGPKLYRSGVVDAETGMVRSGSMRACRSGSCHEPA